MQQKLIVAIVWLGVVALVATTISNAYNMGYLLRSFNRPDEYREYTYVGDDVPKELPGIFSPATMVMESNSRFPVTDDDKWATIVPPGRGFVRLGPKGRPFAVSTFHQLHCVNGIRFTYIAARDGLFPSAEGLSKAYKHANHCFDFLRQMILCGADRALVPTDVNGKQNSSRTEPGDLGLHRCRDWVQVRDAVTENYEKWKQVDLDLDRV